MPVAPRRTRSRRPPLRAAGAAVLAVLAVLVLLLAGAEAGRRGPHLPVPGVADVGAVFAAPAGAPPAPAAMGRPARDGMFEFTVRRVERRAVIGAGPLRADARGRFVIVYVDVRNIGDRSRSFNSAAQRMSDATGREYEPTVALFRLPGAGDAFLRRLAPGAGVRSVPLVFDLPSAARPAGLRLHDSFFSGGVELSVRVR